MKRSFRYLIRGLSNRVRRTLTAILVIICCTFQTYAQQYATSQSNDDDDNGLATASVTDPDNALGAANETYATLSASGVVVTQFLTVTSSAFLTLNFAADVPAGKYSYIKIKLPTTSGISLDLGNLLGVLGLLDNETIAVTTDEGNAQSRLVKDEAGILYLQVTSDQAYGSVTVTLDFGNSVGLLGVGLGRINLEVDNIVSYANDAGYIPCESLRRFTNIDDPEASGITVNITDAIINPERAIDNDLSSYSILSNGQVNVITSVSQSVYLGKTVPGSNHIVATIAKPTGLVDIDVLDGIIIRAYLGNTPVGNSMTIESLLLGVSLLIGFDNNQIVTVSFAPNADYDRIVITSGGVANVFTGLRIHDLHSRTPITFTGGRVNGSIAGNPVSSSITAAIANVSPPLPGFSISCGVASDYTYSLYEVDQSGARVLGGTLPPSFNLDQDGLLTGSPDLDEDNTYTFDVQARNQFGQTTTATFVVTIETNLPVTLVKFDAAAEGATAALTWSTSEETNSDRFEIERSPTGRNWLKIGTVSSNHESNAMKYYSFVDSRPLDGENLYRLKMIDFDGTFAYSRLESVKFSTSAFLYPNPVSGTENLQVNIADWADVKSVKIISATGKTILETSSATSPGINTRNLAAGLYFLKTLHHDGTVSTHKFVRQ
jgi:hypothetical protein